MEQEAKIKCPNCGWDLNVSEILYHQLEEDLKQKFNSQLVEEKKKYDEMSAAIRKEKEKLTEERAGIDERIKKELAEKLRSERQSLENEIKKKLEEEEAGRFETMQKELNEKSEKLKEFNRTKAEIETLKREKTELREAIEAETQAKLNSLIDEEKTKIRASEQAKNELQIKELEKKLADQVELTEEMQRKQKQGSQQLTGEVQELAIEEWLKAHFPLDSIKEIKKGHKGADCIQTVNTHTKTGCGSIYYESKRTKDWDNKWIEKFKSDMREIGIDIGILVTQVMPKGMDRMGNVEGIWICSYEEFKGLSVVLRDTVIRINEVAGSQENKGEKVTMLYDYLTGPEFKSQIQAIVEGFTAMKYDLDYERMAMEKLWKVREKQIEKVILNTTRMYGSVKGIAGSAIGTVQALELGESQNQGDIESQNADEREKIM